MSVLHYVGISALLFIIGAIGVMLRRNAIVVFMSIELMLNAANLALVAFSRMHDDAAGIMMVFFVICIAAAEAVVGLAIVIAMFRNKKDVNLDNFNILNL